MTKESIDAFFESEEGKQSLIDFRLKLNQEDAFNSRWIEKIKVYLENTESPDFEKLVQYDDKVSDRLYDKYIDGQSSLIWKVYHCVVEHFGTECEGDWGMFTSEKVTYKGWIFERIVGQGSFVKIYKDEC